MVHREENSIINSDYVPEPPNLKDEKGRFHDPKNTRTRIKVWEWILTERGARDWNVATDCAGTVYYRPNADSEYHKLNKDTDLVELRALFNEYMMNFGSDYDPPFNSLWAEIAYVAKNKLYNPILDKLTKLTWDGRERIFTELAERIEWSVPEMTDDKQLTDFVFSLIFLGVVERAHKPTEIQFIPILYGDQGVGKSSTIEALATLGLDNDTGTTPFYGVIQPNALRSTYCTDSRDNFHVKRYGRALTEIKEIDGLFTGETDSILKGLADGKAIAYRNPYQHSEMEYPYTDILIGTTNKITFLTDYTGNRRYIPIRVEAVTTDITEGGLGWRLDLHPEIVQQLWAEAVALYKTGTTWRDFYTDNVKKNIEGLTELHSDCDPDFEQIFEIIVNRLTDERCKSNSVSFKGIKDEFEKQNPRARELMRNRREFDNRVINELPKHNLIRVIKRHKWGDEDRTGEIVGFEFVKGYWPEGKPKRLPAE